MTDREKAIAYDEAIEKLRNFCRDYDTVSCLIDVKEELAKIFPELAESEDERIRREIINSIKELRIIGTSRDREKALAWLEKQGEHANFRNKIQVGDKVTRNEDGVLVNLSQLKRVAKPRKKQCEQKPLRMVSAKAKEAMYDKPAWSEEDESAYIRIADAVEQLYIEENESEELITWLKSLRPQNQWKPSEEQLEFLQKCIKAYNEVTFPTEVRVLSSLYHDLKKLKEE